MKKTFIINNEETTVEDFTLTHNELRFSLEGVAYHFTAQKENGGHFVLKHEKHNHQGYIGPRNLEGMHPLFLHGGVEASIGQKNRATTQRMGKNAAHTAPMPGTIQKVLVQAGDVVEQGQVLVVMEAMKLQLNIEAAYAGTVEEICCEAGGLVSDGTLLAKVSPQNVA